MLVEISNEYVTSENPTGLDQSMQELATVKLAFSLISIDEVQAKRLAELITKYLTEGIKKEDVTVHMEIEK